MEGSSDSELPEPPESPLLEPEGEVDVLLLALCVASGLLAGLSSEEELARDDSEPAIEFYRCFGCYKKGEQMNGMAVESKGIAR